MLINKNILEKTCDESERLAVFSERVVAFRAAQKLSRRFVRAPRLHLPDICSVVSAFGALDSNGRKCSELLFLLTYHGYKLLGIMLDHLADFGFNFLSWLLLLVTAFRTDKHQGCRFACLRFFELEARTTFRTEFHDLILRYPFWIPFTWSLLNFF